MITLPEQPWQEGDDFTVEETGVRYVYDGEKWLSESGEEADLSVFATKVQLNEVDAASVERDEKLQEQIDKNKVDSESGDKQLQVEIDQIALALETLLVQREHGQWKYIGFTGDTTPSNAGEFGLAVEDIVSSQENIITLNQEDLKGKTHGFGDVEVGDYVEIVNTDEPTSYALFVVTKAPEGTGIVNVEVALRDTGYNIWFGETCEIRFFAINEQDIALEDLDKRYLRKTGGDEMEGPLKVKAHGGDSRSTSRVSTLGVFSDSGSALRLGTTTDRVYIEDENTKFNGGIMVNNIGPKTEDGRGVTLNVEGSNDKHLITKSYVDAADANLQSQIDAVDVPDLSGLVQKSGDTMTGTLEAPRVDIKQADGEAISLIEGKVEGTASSARLTFSNKINANAYGNLEWHGNSGQGWFQFNKDVDFSTKGLHSVDHIRMSGAKTIQEAQTTRIQLDGRVIINKAGTATDGFVLKGTTDQGGDGELLSVYHNSDGLDAINYRGRTGGSTNIATCEYVDSKVASGGSSFTPGDQVAKTGSESNNVGSFWVIDGALYCKV